MESVGAGFRNGIDYRAAELTVLGVEAIGDEAEFFDGVEVGNQARTEVAAFADVAAVDEEGIRGFTLAVHRDVAGVREIPGDRTILLNRGRCARGDACLQAQEIDKAAAVQRKGEHLLRIDDVAELRAFCLDLNSVGGDFDFVGDAADFQRDVVVELVVDLNGDVIHDGGAEAGRRHSKLVGSGREGEDAECAICGGYRFLAGIRGDVGDQDVGADDGTLRPIVDCSLNRAGNVGAHNGRTNERCQQQKYTPRQKHKTTYHPTPSLGLRSPNPLQALARASIWIEQFRICSNSALRS